MNGKSSVALYFYLLSKSDLEANLDSQTFTCLDEIQLQLNTHVPINFGDGLVGFSALLQFLCDKGFIEDEPGELLKESDKFIIKLVLSGNLRMAEINSGISGIGLYLIQRIKCNSYVSVFDKYRTEEALISCLEQLGALPDGSEKTDLSIWNGKSGILLFIANAHATRVYGSLSESLMAKYLQNMLTILSDEAFNWSKLDGWFTVLHLAGRTDIRFDKDQYNLFLDQALQMAHDIPPVDIPYIMLLLEMNSAIIFDNRIIQLNEVLKRELSKHFQFSINQIFPFNSTKFSIELGLEGGVCKVALPLYSLRTGDSQWLELIGIQ